MNKILKEKKEEMQNEIKQINKIEDKATQEIK